MDLCHFLEPHYPCWGPCQCQIQSQRAAVSFNSFQKLPFLLTLVPLQVHEISLLQQMLKKGRECTRAGLLLGWGTCTPGKLLLWEAGPVETEADFCRHVLSYVGEVAPE